MQHPLITVDPKARRQVTLDDCNSLTLHLEVTGASCLAVDSVRIFRRKPQRSVRPADSGKRITELRPGDLIYHYGIARRVVRICLHD